MDVTVDLTHSDYRLVLPILAWCLENDIDVDHAKLLLERWRSTPPYDKVEPLWEVTIPEEYATMFILKFADDNYALTHTYHSED